MKTIPQQCLDIGFDPDLRFELAPVPEALGRTAVSKKFDLLQERLTKLALAAAQDQETVERIQLAARDAAALAWANGFPLLLFPELFGESLGAAESRSQHQKQVLARTKQFWSAAA